MILTLFNHRATLGSSASGRRWLRCDAGVSDGGDAVPPRPMDRGYPYRRESFIVCRWRNRHSTGPPHWARRPPAVCVSMGSARNVISPSCRVCASSPFPGSPHFTRSSLSSGSLRSQFYRQRSSGAPLGSSASGRRWLRCDAGVSDGGDADPPRPVERRYPYRRLGALALSSRMCADEDIGTPRRLLGTSLQIDQRSRH